jgi:GLPGLI family protein
MKKLFFTAIATALASITSFAQIGEGKIKYEIKMSTDNPEVEMQLSMMQNSTMELTYSGAQSRQVIDMGGFVTTTTISNSATGEMLTLMDGMMGKFATKSNMNDEVEAEEAIEFEFVNETRQILGYTCYKALFSAEDGAEAVYWYTKDLTPPSMNNGYFQKSIPGMPLSFEVTAPEIKMEFIAVDIQTKLKKGDKNFNMTIPEGYQKMDMEGFGGMMGE